MMSILRVQRSKFSLSVIFILLSLLCLQLLWSYEHLYDREGSKKLSSRFQRNMRYLASLKGTRQDIQSTSVIDSLDYRNENISIEQREVAEMEEESLLQLDASTGEYRRTIMIRNEANRAPQEHGSQYQPKSSLNNMAEALTVADASELSTAMGGNVVDRALATLPGWMILSSFEGRRSMSFLGSGPNCLWDLPGSRSSSEPGRQGERLMLGIGSKVRVLKAVGGAANNENKNGLNCIEPNGGQTPRASTANLPLVSFILTFKDHFRETEECLASILRYSAEVESAEFILIDDGSTENGKRFRTFVREAQRLLRIEIRLIRHRRSLGYLQSVTDAAQLATGKFLLLLNNDLILHQYCIANLLATFETHPSVGLVAPRFVDKNGKLLEAGGLIFSDAKGWSYGRGDTARELHSLAPYASVRETDYGSAACIMVPRALFVRLGLYDRFFLPAYYEDTDMAFQVRVRARLRVFVQPFASVTHAESTTYGGKGREAKKSSLMEEGRRKFLSKWKRVLLFHGPSKIESAPKNEKWLRDHDDVFDQATRLYSFRILFLAFCNDPTTGKNLLDDRLLTTIRVYLAARAHITVVFVNRNGDEVTLSRLRWMGVSVIPLNELVLTQRARHDACRFDLVYGHSLPAYLTLKHAVNAACPPMQMPSTEVSKQKESQGCPVILDLSADITFTKRFEALSPAERDAIKTATVLIVASEEQQKELLQIIPSPRNGERGREGDVLILPRPVGNNYPETSTAAILSSIVSDREVMDNWDFTEKTFGQRKGLVVAGDLTNPLIASAIADFAQRTVQLLVAKSQQQVTYKDDNRTNNVLRERGKKNMHGLVLHVVHTVARRSRVTMLSPGEKGMISPILLRLNGTSGVPTLAASTSLHQVGRRDKVREIKHDNGKYRQHVIKQSESSSVLRHTEKPFEIIIHGCRDSECDAILSTVMSSARLHIVVCPEDMVDEGLKEAVHDATAAGIPTVATAAAARRLGVLGSFVEVQGGASEKDRSTTIHPPASGGIEVVQSDGAPFAAAIARLYLDSARYRIRVNDAFRSLGRQALILKEVARVVAASIRRILYHRPLRLIKRLSNHRLALSPN